MKRAASSAVWLLCVAGVSPACVDLRVPAGVQGGGPDACVTSCDAQPTRLPDGGVLRLDGAPSMGDASMNPSPDVLAAGPDGPPFVEPRDAPPSSMQDAAPVVRMDAAPVVRMDAAPVVRMDAPPVTPPPNKAPMVVLAGTATFFTTTGGTLTAQVSDDGLPTPPGALTIVWSKQSGPGTVTFTAGNAASTGVSFSMPGSYALRVTASDGAASAAAQVNVTVHGLDVALAGRWSFDTTGSTAMDLSGGGNHAQLLAGAVIVAPGQVGERALGLDAAGAYAKVTDPTSERLDFGSGDFTVTFWMKTTQARGTSAEYPMLINKFEYRANDQRAGWEFFSWWPDATRRNAFKIWDGGATAYLEAKGLDDGKWHHLAGRRSGNQIALLVDGAVSASRTHTLGNLSSQGPLFIGGWEDDAWGDFRGTMDDVRIYGRALSDAEIALLASGTVP